MFKAEHHILKDFLRRGEVAGGILGGVTETGCISDRQSNL